METDKRFQDAMNALVTRVNEDIRNTAALQKLNGEVIGLKTRKGATYFAAIQEQKMHQESSAEPTIWIEGEENIILNIITGRLDPVVAMATRKLKVSTTPMKGPYLRQLFYNKEKEIDR